MRGLWVCGSLSYIMSHHDSVYTSVYCISPAYIRANILKPICDNHPHAETVSMYNECTYPHSIYNIIVDHFYPLVTTQSLIMIHKQRMSWITKRTASFCLQVAVTLRFGPDWARRKAGCVKYFQREVRELKLHAVQRYDGMFWACPKLAICHVGSRRYWHLVTCHESHSVIFVTTPIINTVQVLNNVFGNNIILTIFCTFLSHVMSDPCTFPSLDWKGKRQNSF